VVLWNLRWALRSLRQMSISRNPAKAPQTAASIWYTRMLRTVARRGYQKAAHQTASEFVRGIPDPALRDAVSRFTERYERARFGDSAPDAEQLPELFQEVAGRKE
jgi:hypothetical protein